MLNDQSVKVCPRCGLPGEVVGVEPDRRLLVAHHVLDELCVVSRWRLGPRWWLRAVRRG